MATINFDTPTNNNLNENEDNFDGNIFLTRPYFLHYNYDTFWQIFQVWRPKIESYGENYLRKSIAYQEAKEKYIYKLLELEPTEWKKIGERLFGVFEGDNENNKTIRESRMADFLEAFTTFFNEGVFSNLNTKNFKGNEDGTALANSTETFNDIAQKFIDAYNNPVEEFIKWYKTSNLNNKGIFNEADIQFLNNIFKTYRNSKGNTGLLDSDGKIRDVQSIGQENAMKLLKRSSGILNNLIGAIGEQATISLRGNWIDRIKKETGYIIKGYGTSDYTKDLDADLDTEDIKKTDLITGNIEFYEKQQKRINQILGKNGITLASKDGSLKFGFTYSEEDTKTLTKNLKADEFFSFKVEVEESLINFKTMGISSKTSWGITSDNLKLYSGSLQSAFENMFKGILTEDTITETAKIVNFLQYSVLNAAGAGYYNAANEEKASINVNDVISKIIDYYAFQWFTGGISPQTHADFFSIYSDGKQYFIPMSVILKEILELKSGTFLNNSLYKPFDKKLKNIKIGKGYDRQISYMSKKQYESIKNLKYESNDRNEDSMINTARTIFNSGILREKKELTGAENKGAYEIVSKSSGSINLTKSKLLKKLKYMV